MHGAALTCAERQSGARRMDQPPCGVRYAQVGHPIERRLLGAARPNGDAARIRYRRGERDLLRPLELRVDPPKRAVQIADREERLVRRRIDECGETHVLVGIGIERRADAR